MTNISIEEAKRYLQLQDRMIRAVPEVKRVFGKAGRSETPTDAAPLSMVETVVQLKPRDQWRTIDVPRWYSSTLPRWMRPALRPMWPDQRRMTWDELVADLNRRMQIPGWTNAWTMPIKTRIDMLSTGIRTPIGVKVLGASLDTIERIGMDLERVLSSIPATRSVYSDRNTGGFYLDIVPDRQALARHGLTVGDVQDVIEAAIGGEPIDLAVEGRNRFTINVRYPQELRQNLEQLRRTLIPLPSGGSRSSGGMNSMARATGAGAIGGAMGGGAMAGAESRGEVVNIRIRDLTASAIECRLNRRWMGREQRSFGKGLTQGIHAVQLGVHCGACEFKGVVNSFKQSRGLLKQRCVEFEFQLNAGSARTEMGFADLAAEPDVGLE